MTSAGTMQTQSCGQGLRYELRMPAAYKGSLSAEQCEGTRIIKMSN